MKERSEAAERTSTYFIVSNLHRPVKDSAKEPRLQSVQHITVEGSRRPLHHPFGEKLEESLGRSMDGGFPKRTTVIQHLFYRPRSQRALAGQDGLEAVARDESYVF